MGGLQNILRFEAVTFDDFYTLRYPIRERDGIIYPILKTLKSQGLDVNDAEFLRQYFREDRLYRKRLEETLCESLLDDIVMRALVACGYEPKTIGKIVKEAVDYGLTTRKAKWFPEAKKVLSMLQEKEYKLGLISNTHWRISQNVRREFEKFFETITLSYEHGYAKPHQSIFIVTLKKLGIEPSQCLHIGDDPIADIQGAKSIGMKTTFINKRGAKADADIEIKRLIELTPFL